MQTLVAALRLTINFLTKHGSLHIQAAHGILFKRNAYFLASKLHTKIPLSHVWQHIQRTRTMIAVKPSPSFQIPYCKVNATLMLTSQDIQLTSSQKIVNRAKTWLHKKSANT